MNKQSLGCNFDITNNIVFSIRDFNLVKPHIFYENGNIIKNFDIYFQFDEEPNKYLDLCKLLKIPTIGCFRYDKKEQQIILKNNDFNTPDNYSSHLIDFRNDSFRFDYLYVLLEKINENEEIIIKSNGGARGLGQIILKKSELYNFFENFDTKDFLLDKKIGGNINDDIRFEYLVSTVRKNDFFISKKLDILEEYRILNFFDEEPIVIKRKVVKDNWQANISVTGEYEIINYKQVFSDEFNNKLQKFLLNLNTPFLSIDLYKDSNNEWGIFEFQMQYGYKAPNKSEIVDKTNKSISNLIKYNKFI